MNLSTRERTSADFYRLFAVLVVVSRNVTSQIIVEVGSNSPVGSEYGHLNSLYSFSCSPLAGGLFVNHILLIDVSIKQAGLV